MKRWEYKSLSPAQFIGEPPNYEDTFDAKLAELGQDGWELVCVSPGSYFTFKRPLPSTGL